MSQQIEEELLRFVIPFHFENSREIANDDYVILRKKGWKRYEIIKGEIDIYSYIVDLLSEKKSTAIGSSWCISENSILNQKYYAQVKDQTIFWKFKEIGLVLFDTGIGLLWYEIGSLKKRASLTDDLELYQEFSYQMKELARGENEKNYLQFSENISKSKRRIEDLDSEGVVIDEQKDTKDGLVIKGHKKINVFLDLLLPFLEGIEIDTYFSDRNGTHGVIPDRALPFTWVLSKAGMVETDDAFRNVFRLGRCYSNSYMSPKYSEDCYFIPFDDSVWYACVEGCANYVFPKSDNIFFKEGYRARLSTYFYIFMLCVGQYYSLLNFAKEIADLQTNDSMYSFRNTILEDLLERIRLFHLKNKYLQIGHLTQHNDYYKYLKKSLSIDEMHQELENELQSLYEMVEKKKSIRNSKRYRVISIISALFVGVDVFGNISQMYENFSNKNWNIQTELLFSLASMGLIAGIGVIVWVACFVMEKSLDNHASKKKNLLNS